MMRYLRWVTPAAALLVVTDPMAGLSRALIERIRVG
jgi:hypothetical protein